jgi:two-component system LytT family sensor kinase
MWSIAAAFWVFIGLLYIGQVWWLTRTPGVRAVLTPATWIWQFGFYLSWIPLSVLLWWMTRNWTPANLGWPRLIGLHLVTLVCVSVVQSTLLSAVALRLLPERESLWSAVTNQVRGRLYMEAVMYLAVVMTNQTLLMYDRSRRRELQAAQLAAQLSSAQLSSLRAQLHPHFLFNSLHTIASLVRDGRSAEAVTLISDMSGLLRRVLDTRSDTHSIEDELALVRTFLDVQMARFPDRLAAAISIDGSAAGARVPVLIVQPLVDNALRHGLAQQVAPGQVAVDVRRDGAALVIHVNDTGAGVPHGWRMESSGGTGLANIAARLRVLYGEEASIHAGPHPDRGFAVVIRLPFAT